jgi:Ribbon-helix-helix protein, copG family
MRTTENLTVSLPPAIKREMQRVAKRENRTLSELVRETFRHYQNPSVNIYDLIRQIAPTPPEIRAMQEDAKRAGTDKLTMAQIQREIRAVRNQHDRQHGGKKGSKRNRK